jgi:hypothetical protein
VTRYPVPLAVFDTPGALAAQVGGVPRSPQRLVLEPLPLGEEVIAVVITDIGDLGMHHRYLADVWGVDDHLTAFGDDRLQLVEALGGGPDVFVFGGHDREHPTHRSFQILDVGLR